MTTLQELTTRATQQRDAAQTAVDRAQAELASLREDPNLTTEMVRSTVATRDAADRSLAEAQSSLDGLLSAQREEDEVQQQYRQTSPAANRAPAYDRVARVGAEERTYQGPQASRDGRGVNGPDFLRDLYDYQVKRDPGAGGRLERHGQEVERLDPMFAQRMTGTGAVSGFVPPQYLTDLFAEFARAGRPLANLCSGIPLPETGMEVDIPRVTTATTTAVQTAEGGAIGNTDLDDTLLAAPVRTVAGYTDVSRQAIERGVMVQSLVFGDLAADYNAKLDTQLINGSGASGQHTGVLNVVSINGITYTDASPTIPELWPKLADAAGQVMGQRFTGPTAFAMRSNVWAWILAQVDTAGRPLVEPGTIAVNPIAVASTRPVDYTVTAVGSLFGVPVVLDNNIPNNLGAGTNETRIIAADFRDLILMEDDSAAPVQLRFDDVLSGTLQVRLLAYGYSAFAAGRQPKAISVISGTGLIVPAL
ncbi:phage major capsid protein [Streptomyces sp. NBC_00554]|uniref:phage major capsid protein n=1 Tax=Streptomyces sp. NBC_00554 TaxID=2903661 RepID=UPI00352F3BA7|nr:phage major capsid protein [Streptomyces sp. NBC_00554]